MSISENLNKAADVVETRGWGKGHRSWGEEAGPVCLEGGLAVALGCDTTDSAYLAQVWPTPEFKALVEYVRSLVTEKDLDGLEGTTFHPWMYNDRVCKDQTEAVATLRAVALIEAAKENANAEVRVSA